MSVSRVLIVGGGIAGLATAAGLRRLGVACEIVEQTETWAPVGAGIVLGVNAMSVLGRLGVVDQIIQRGVSLGRGGITDHTGRVLATNDFRDLHTDFGPTIAIHRAALHDVLLEAAADTPISLGTSIDHLTQEPDECHVEFLRCLNCEAGRGANCGQKRNSCNQRLLHQFETPVTYRRKSPAYEWWQGA